MRQRSPLRHEIRCGAVLLTPGSRAKAVSSADRRGLRFDLGGSAQIVVMRAEPKAYTVTVTRPTAGATYSL